MAQLISRRNWPGYSFLVLYRSSSEAFLPLDPFTSLKCRGLGGDLPEIDPRPLARLACVLPSQSPEKSFRTFKSLFVLYLSTVILLKVTMRKM